VAILAIHSNQGSLMGMERFTKRHRMALNELLGTDGRADSKCVTGALAGAASMG